MSPNIQNTSHSDNSIGNPSLSSLDYNWTAKVYYSLPSDFHIFTFGIPLGLTILVETIVEFVKIPFKFLKKIFSSKSSPLTPSQKVKSIEKRANPPAEKSSEEAVVSPKNIQSETLIPSKPEKEEKIDLINPPLKQKETPKPEDTPLLKISAKKENVVSHLELNKSLAQTGLLTIGTVIMAGCSYILYQISSNESDDPTETTIASVLSLIFSSLTLAGLGGLYFKTKDIHQAAKKLF